jgi:hypothetical protein
MISPAMTSQTEPRHPLLPVVISAAVALVALNMAMAALNHRLPYRLKLDAIAKAQDRNLLFVGNSLLDHHLDEGALAKAAAEHGVRYAPLNSALGASEPPEQRLLFHYAEEKHPGITTLVVGFFDFQLTEADHSRVADLTGNRMIGIDHRFSAAEAAQAYGFNARNRAVLALLRALPMAANRATAWKYVELLRRSMASIGMPAVATNSMGRVDDFSALEAGTSQIFDARAQEFLAHPDHFNASYEAIFTEAHKAGMNVTIVVMPMSPSHLAGFYARPLWGQYLQAVERLAAAHHVRLIDASQWMPEQNDFVDHLHMTQEAAHEFSVRLGTELPAAIQR